MTKKEAQEIINENLGKTHYCDGSIEMAEMMNMLRYEMGFGLAESKVIMAALVLSGANFQE